jgi:hypothetical protein
MTTQRFTTGEAAEYLGLPAATLRTWIHRGWVDQVRTYQSVALPKGKWDRLSPRELVSLRLVKEFNQFMAITTAAEVAAMCGAAVDNFLFGGIAEDRRNKYRFVGVQLLTSEGKTLYAPHYDESLAKFQSEGVFGYFVIDLAAIPIPTTSKESA